MAGCICLWFTIGARHGPEGVFCRAQKHVRVSNASNMLSRLPPIQGELRNARAYIKDFGILYTAFVAILSMNKTASVVINICRRFELISIHVHLKNISNNLTARPWLSGLNYSPPLYPVIASPPLPSP